ncbi:SIMPL domain-containing protein [Halovivax gelatinilyticus]|uniref:SIMPL domain-containing protein n=1 Tax=Halovivax gelatinilyticus TaxID=2961597 RepID=UPI0020CA8969|nr:SIMPL domain-containing protein [Halovivax gelatinilyticus]
MQRRDVLGASGIALLTVAAGCLSSAFEDGDDRSNADDGSTDADTGVRGAPPDDDPGNAIEVRADGLVEAEPNRATLTVGVEARGESAAAVTDELAEAAESLREAFAELGIPDENVESGRYDVRQPRNGTRYEGVHQFRAIVDDPDRVGEVIDETAAAGADDVGRIRFGVRDETRAELRTQALDEALANADAEAEHVADNRGVDLTGTRSVSTTAVDVVPVEATVDEMDVADDDAGRPPTDVESGLVTVSASVTVTYSFDDAAE